jgi:hypothetical protein
MYALKFLSCIISVYNIHYITEDYTEIFHLSNEEDVPPIQCQATLDHLTSTREADGFNIIFSYFYVPALTPCFSFIETSL